MFGRLGLKEIFLIFAILIIIIYSVVLPEYQRYQYSQLCERGPCPTDLQEIWKDLGCPNSMADSLIYKVYILDSNDGSVALFNCEFGPMYEYANSTYLNRIIIPDCNRETIELLDRAIKGQNTTVLTWLDRRLPYPQNFNNYTTGLFLCKKLTEGPNAGKHVVKFFVNYSGQSFG